MRTARIRGRVFRKIHNIFKFLKSHRNVIQSTGCHRTGGKKDTFPVYTMIKHHIAYMHTQNPLFDKGWISLKAHSCLGPGIPLPQPGHVSDIQQSPKACVSLAPSSIGISSKYTESGTC